MAGTFKQMTARTAEECKKMVEDAEQEREDMLSDARQKVTTIRGSMKRECENVSTYMASLMESVEGVVKACNETKTITDKAFKGIGGPAERPALPDEDNFDDEDIPQIKFQS